MSELVVIDMFAGAGGFSLGAHQFTDNVTGIELAADAVETQIAAGMTCAQQDICKTDPMDFAKTVDTDHLHLHASPPCQTFSAAGKGKGREHVELLSQAAYGILRFGYTDLDLTDIDPGSLLVLEPARWIAAMRPDSVSLEQVRAVAPIWAGYALGLEAIGYDVWAGLLGSEQYGVPQTRVRAWLGAKLLRGDDELVGLAPPKPTHSKYYVRKPDKLDPDVPRWVTMAEALGWDDDDKAGFPRKADNDNTVTLDGVDYRARDLRDGDQPAQSVTEKTRSWTHWRQNANKNATVRPVDAPAGTVIVGNAMLDQKWTHMLQGEAGGEGRPRRADQPAPTQGAKGTATVTNSADNWHGQDNIDARKAPATTVQGDSRIWPRGHKINQADIDRLGEDEAKAKYGDRAGTKARRVTVEEAGILQGFPGDFPWQGSKTSQFRQCGNAVNPQVAVAVLESVLR